MNWTMNGDSEAASATDDSVAECSEYQAEMMMMSRDLRHAIDQLRAVPSHDVTVQRVPLRSVNSCRRLSLPPGSRDDGHQLHVRHCSSLSDEPLHTCTGASHYVTVSLSCLQLMLNADE